MAVSQPTSSPVPSLGARVVVTLGVLAAYRLGAYAGWLTALVVVALPVADMLGRRAA